MAAAQDGDHDAYAALLDDIGPFVMRVLRRRVRSDDEAQDLYQEVFMALHRARHTYQRPRPVEPWLFAIVRHVVADHRDGRRRRAAREVLVANPPSRSVEGDGLVKTSLEQALRRLTPTQREALQLLHVDGVPLASAARRAGATPGTLKVRAHRAFKVLRGLL